MTAKKSSRCGPNRAFSVIPPVHTEGVVMVADPIERQATHEAYEARIGELMSVINGATAELVDLIGNVVETEAWQTAGGIKSPEHWVTWQCGFSQARAQSWVQMARRRTELPESTGQFDRGQITEDVMAAIARRMPAVRDAEVAELAPKLLYSQIDRLLRTMPKSDPPKLEP